MPAASHVDRAGGCGRASPRGSCCAVASAGRSGSTAAVRRVPWSFLLLAVIIRVVVAARTAVPGRDGVSYLWMALQFAHGHPAALFATVFHPLYPALVGALLWCWPGVDPVVAGQIVASGLGALAVVPLWAVTRALFGPAAAIGAAAAYSTGAWFARHPAECMSEGPFYLCVAVWAWSLVSPTRRAWLAGTAAGLAFLARPEGAALVVVAVAVLAAERRTRSAAVVGLSALPWLLALPFGFASLGAGFTLTPKAAFNYEVGVGHAASPVLHYLGEALKLPLAAGEELGWLWLPLAIAGVVQHRPRRVAGPTTLLLLPFALQCLVVPMLQSHWRFLSGFGVLLLPFAGAGAAALWAWLVVRQRLLPWCLVLALAGSECRVFAARNQDRGIERELGRALGSQLAAGEFVVSDMPRLDYFAGQKPPPPRPILPAEVRQRAGQPGCRFVVLVTGRTELDDAALHELGLEPMTAPALLSADVERRGLRLFAKSRAR